MKIKKLFKRLGSLLLALLLLWAASYLLPQDESADESEPPYRQEQSDLSNAAPDTPDAPDAPDEPQLPSQGGYYYDVESVVLYLNAYGTLPSNFITKSEAESLGWSGGSVQRYREGAAIGGDRFGNREGLLPKASDRSYTECDIDTDGADSRGAKRLVFSDDGLYFYTEDHYESFAELTVENGSVVWK